MSTAGIMLLLVFCAVAWITWLLVPALAQIGLERSSGDNYVKTSEVIDDPILRFTTQARLRHLRVSFGILFGGLTLGGLLVGGVYNPAILFPATIVAGVIASFVPKIWITVRISRRNRAFENKLVDFLMGINNSLMAGVDPLASISYVVRDFNGPIAEEFGLVLKEHRAGLTLDEALVNLSLRMPTEDVKIVATSIRISDRTGMQLRSVLNKIAETIRERIEFFNRLKTKTMQARFEALGMALAPLMAFILLYYLDPHLMEPLYTTSAGWKAVGVVVILEVLGFICMRKIMHIEA